MGPRSGFVHIVHEVREWGGGIRTIWKCHRGSIGSLNAVHLDEPGDRIRCQLCIATADDNHDVQYVYVARVGDLVKVGCSNQVGRRLHDLTGELVARVPGSFDLERRVLSLIGTAPARGREWFPASAEDEILAALRSVA